VTAPAFLRGARFAAIGPTCPHCAAGNPVKAIGSVRRHLVGDPLAEGASFVLCVADVDEREMRRRDNVVIALVLAGAVGIVVGLWRAAGGRAETIARALGVQW
jgi:hypothetical protein